MLMRLHDRLLHRQAWRTWRELYGPGNEAKLADLVLELLDEEIDGGGKANSKSRRRDRIDRSTQAMFRSAARHEAANQPAGPAVEERWMV